MYLGGFDNEEQAALAYDIAAIKFRAHDANTNYSISNYEQELLHFNEVSLRCVKPHKRLGTTLSKPAMCDVR